TVHRPASNVSSSGTKKNLLDALREKYGDKYSIEEVKEAEELNIEKLQRCWDSFGAQLEQQQKHSSSATFKIAKLEIVSENRFTATVSALTAQRFIEQEKMMLTDYIHQQFNNRSITFSVLVEESVKEEVPKYITMTNKKKFERIAEQYPMVKELKDKLKLELE
ncbi:MAG TPA: DNA polymerase III subunit gamma/tau, partial [Patescibacteria group bacterium]